MILAKLFNILFLGQEDLFLIMGIIPENGLLNQERFLSRNN